MNVETSCCLVGEFQPQPFDPSLDIGFWLCIEAHFGIFVGPGAYLRPRFSDAISGKGVNKDLELLGGALQGPWGAFGASSRSLGVPLGLLRGLLGSRFQLWE